MGREIARTLKTPRGELAIEELAVGVVRVGFRGYATLEVAEAIMASLDAAIEARGTIEVFDDWEHATGYDSEVRRVLTEWTKTHQPHVASTTVLVRSKILAMGLSVANLALRRPVDVTHDRRTFEQALLRARVAARRLREQERAVG